jgi:C4-dicarboxylate-specific signal transduction histidine kinase
MTATLNLEAALLADETALADVGELTGSLVQEANALLNHLQLHLAVIQQVGQSGLAPDLDLIRRQIKHFGGLVARFQRRRQRERGETPIVEVNQAMTDAARLWPAPATKLELEQNLPGVRGHAADVRRLCRFLLANAVRAVGEGAKGPGVLARTKRSSAGVQLTIEDAGPDVPLAQLSRIFEPGNECREGMCCLELAACRTLIRRLRGSIDAQPRPGGGLVMTATLPAVPA